MHTGMAPFIIVATTTLYRANGADAQHKFDVVEVAVQDDTGQTAYQYQMILGIFTLSKTKLIGRYKSRNKKFQTSLVDTFFVTAAMTPIEIGARSTDRFLPYPMYKMETFKRGRNYLPELKISVISPTMIYRPACFIPAFDDKVLPAPSACSLLKYRGFSYPYCDRSDWMFNASHDVFTNANPIVNGEQFLLTTDHVTALRIKQINRFRLDHFEDPDGSDGAEEIEDTRLIDDGTLLDHNEGTDEDDA